MACLPHDPIPASLDPRTVEIARRIVYRRHGNRLSRAGLDPEDVCQEVLLTAIRRTRAGKGWDPTRAGLSTWVFQITRTTIDHALRGQRSRGRRERLGRDADAGLGVGTAGAPGIASMQALVETTGLPAGVLAGLAEGLSPEMAALEAGLPFADLGEVEAVVRKLGRV